jgi:hypothetical protein
VQPTNLKRNATDEFYCRRPCCDGWRDERREGRRGEHARVDWPCFSIIQHVRTRIRPAAHCMRDNVNYEPRCPLLRYFRFIALDWLICARTDEGRLKENYCCNNAKSRFVGETDNLLNWSPGHLRQCVCRKTSTTNRWWLQSHSQESCACSKSTKQTSLALSPIMMMTPNKIYSIFLCWYWELTKGLQGWLIMKN